MTVFFISGMMGVSAFADSDSETKTCKESHVPVERTNGKVVCMTERTAERTVERFSWVILNDPTVTTKSVSDDPGSTPSDETTKPKQLKPAAGTGRSVSCLDDVCVETVPGEQTTVETEITVHSHRAENGTSFITKQKRSATFSFTPYFPEHVPEGCTDADGMIKWGDKHKGSKILADLQKEIDSGKTQLCVTLVVNKKYQDDVIDFLRERGADVEGELVYHEDGKLVKVGGGGNTVNALVSLSLLYELADRDDVVNLDVYGKWVSKPFHLSYGHDFKITSLLQNEIDSKRYICTPKGDSFDKCPPMKLNEDGQYIVDVFIIVEHLNFGIIKSQMLAKGLISDSMLREESNPIVDAEIKKQHKIIAQPILDLLAENNLKIVDYYEGGNHITVHNMPIDLIPNLVDSDLVWLVGSKTKWHAYCEYADTCPVVNPNAHCPYCYGIHQRLSDIATSDR